MRFGRVLTCFVLFVILVVLGYLYRASMLYPVTPVFRSGDWCGTAIGQGPDGIDAVLCVSGTTSRFVLATRPSMYTEHSQDDECLVQCGHVAAIQPWARSVPDDGVYDFCTTDGDCRFGLSAMTTPLTFVPLGLDKPISARALLPVRDSECPPGTDCGSGLYGLFRQPCMQQIQQWYGVYTDSILSAAINFRGPEFSDYTLAITRDNDVQICHGRRADLPGTQSFNGTLNFVDLSTAFPIFSGACHLVFMQVLPEEQPLPMQTTSDVPSFLESDRVLRTLLVRQTTISDRNLIGRSLTEISFVM